MYIFKIALVKIAVVILLEKEFKLFSFSYIYYTFPPEIIIMD